MSAIKEKIIREANEYIIRQAISKSEFARRSELSKSVVARILSGEGNLTPRIAKCFAIAMGKPENHFVDRLIEEELGSATYIMEPKKEDDYDETEVTCSNPNCGKKFSARGDDKYCRFCGAALTKRCPNCSRQLGLDWAFCQQCGQELPPHKAGK